MDFEEFELSETLVTFADMQDQIEEEDENETDGFSQAQYEPDQALFKCYFEHSTLLFEQGGIEAQEAFSEVCVPEIADEEIAELQLFKHHIYVYRGYVFKNAQVIGFVGAGRASIAIAGNNLVVVTNDWISVFDILDFTLVERILARNVFPRTPVELMVIPAVKGVHFSLLMFCRNGLVYLCQAETAGTRTGLKFEFLTKLPWSNTYEYKTFTQSYEPAISNNGTGEQCCALVTYWTDREQFVFLEFDQWNCIFEVAAWSDKTLERNSYVCSNDCRILTRGKLGYSLMQFDLSCSNIFCSVHNVVLAYIALFLRIIVLIVTQSARQAKIIFSDAKILEYDKANKSVIIEFNGGVYYCENQEMKPLSIPLFLSNAYVIPGIEMLNMEQTNTVTRPIDMELSYSFYEQAGTEDERLQAMNSLSSSLTRSKKGEGLSFAVASVQGGNLVLEMCKSNGLHSVQTLTFKIGEIPPQNTEIELLTGQTETELYNPFFDTATFDFEELGFAYHFCYDCTENCDTNGILHYVFKQNDVWLICEPGNGIRFVRMVPSSILATFKAQIEEDNMKEFETLFADACQSQKICCVVNNLVVEQSAVYEQKSMEMCFLFKELYKADSPLFLDLHVLRALIGGDAKFENIAGAFQGIRQLADYNLYLKRGDCILEMLRVLFSALVEHRFASDDQDLQAAHLGLIIDEFFIQLQLLMAFAAPCADSLEFASTLASREKQFLSLAEHSSIYGRSKELECVNLLFERYEGSAMFPNMPAPKVRFTALIEVLSPLIYPSVREFAFYLDYLQTNFSDDFMTQFKLVHILQLNQQFAELNSAQRIKSGGSFAESLVYAEHGGALQRLYKELHKSNCLQIVTVAEYAALLQRIICQLVRWAVYNEQMDSFSDSFKHSLLTMLEELQDRADGTYFAFLAECKEYLWYSAATQRYAGSEAYLRVTAYEKLAVLIATCHIDIHDVTGQLFVACHAEGQLIDLLKLCCNKIDDFEYLDAFCLGFIEKFVFLDHFAEFCEVIYESLPIHYSTLSVSLYKALEKHIHVDELYKLFLGNGQPFARSLLREESIFELAQGFAEEGNEKMLEILFDTHGDSLTPRLQELIGVAIHNRTQRTLLFWQKHYHIEFCYVAITQNMLSVVSSELFRIQEFLSEQGVAQDVLCRLMCELAIETEKFAAEAMYVAWIKHEVPLFTISQALTPGAAVEHVLGLLESVTVKITFLNICAFISSIEKLSILLKHYEYDGMPLLQLGKDFVNDNLFIFATYEEIITANLTAQLAALMQHQELHANYKMAKLLFRNANIEITELPQEKDQFYLPKYSFAETLRYVDDHFAKMQPLERQTTAMHNIPCQLQFEYLTEYLTNEEDVLKVKLLFLLSGCGCNIKTELSMFTSTELIELLTNKSLEHQVDERCYDLIGSSLDAVELMNLIDKAAAVDCEVVYQYYKRFLPEEYIAALFEKHQFARAVTEESGLVRSVILGDHLSDEELLIDLTTLFEEQKALNALELFETLDGNGELHGQILSELITKPLRDSQQNMELAEFEPKRTDGGWEDSTSASESEEDASVDEWQSESSASSTNDNAMYRGVHENQYYTAQTQEFLMERGDFKDVSVEVIGASPALSLSVKLHICAEVAITQADPLDDVVCAHFCAFLEITEQNVFDKVFDLIELIENLGWPALLAQFDPVVACIGLEYTCTEERIIERLVERFKLMQYLNVKYDMLFQLYRKYPFVPQLCGCDIFEQLCGSDHLQEPAVKDALKRLFKTELDYLFVLNGGCDVVQSLILAAYFKESATSQIPMKLGVSNEFSIDQQIKMAYALTPQQASEFLNELLDELQSFSFEKYEYFAIILHELGKLPPNIRNRIVSELDFIAEYNPTIETDGVYVFCKMPERDEVAVQVDYLAFSNRFGMLAGDLAVTQFKAVVATDEVEIQLLHPREQRRRLVRLPKRERI